MRRGLGLVELMLAAVVLASAMAVLFHALGLSVRGTEQVSEELVATQIAAELCDLFAGLGHGALPAADGEPAAAAAKIEDRAAGERVRKRLAALTVPKGYQARIAIEPLPDKAGSVGRCKRILVQVRWGARSVKLARLVADEVGLEP